MKPLSQRQLQALASLHGNQDFEVVVAMLKEAERDEIERCISGNEEQRLRAAGAVVTIRDFVVAASTARDTLEKRLNKAVPQPR
jgi:hypothetical protein